MTAVTPIIISCFGRGASNIVLNILGSSEDVFLCNWEWHRAAMEGTPLAKRAISWLHWQGIPVFANSIGRTSYDRIVKDVAAQNKPSARFAAVKLMGRYNALYRAIEAPFGRAKYVVVVRDPVRQCDSMVRSGNTVEQAIRRYELVAKRMDAIQGSKPSEIFRFEDFLLSPIDYVDGFYKRLGLNWRGDHSFVYKVKRFGKERQGPIDAATGELVPINAGNWREYFNAGQAREVSLSLSDKDQKRVADALAPWIAKYGYS